MTRFLGLYRLQRKAGGGSGAGSAGGGGGAGSGEVLSIRFVVMKNIFDTPLRVYETYDLKGSTVDRTMLDKVFSRTHTPNSYRWNSGTRALL
jgi:hypothetical protein